MLRQDDEAIRYFDIARHSDTPSIRQEAERSYRALRHSNARFHTTTWLLPMFYKRESVYLSCTRPMAYIFRRPFVMVLCR